MFCKKVVVRSKDSYGEDIKKKVIRMLKKLKIEYTENLEPSNLAIVIGGDGTLFRNHWGLTCPIFGINPGNSVGYFMAADNKDYEKKLLSVLQGTQGKDYFVHKLMRLEAYVNDDKLDFLAMNDVLVSAAYTRTILDCELQIGDKISIERATGILIYTPAGSNAYAGSAGAKKLLYDDPRFGVAAVAPYMGQLKRGEILLEKGDVNIISMNQKAEVCIDGQDTQTFKLKNGDKATIKKSDSPVKIIGFGERFK
jgi:NAD kinase